MRPSTAGHMTAPPTPISARQMITRMAVGMSPVSSEKNPNTAAPARNTRLRPSRSASRPPVTISTPNTSAYPLITHWAWPSVVCRSVSIRGMATLSAVKSLAITKTPSAMAPRASQARVPIRFSSATLDTYCICPVTRRDELRGYPPRADTVISAGFASVW